MKITSDQSLKDYNTFGIAARARQFAIVKKARDLSAFLKGNTEPVFILGGGSNMLLTRDIDQLVLKL